MNEIEREQALRRLLTEAVEPVTPAPGAQTRLFARIRNVEARGPFHRKAFRWAGAVTATAAVVIGATVVFAGGGGHRSPGDTSGSSTAARAPAPPTGAINGLSSGSSGVQPSSAALPLPSPLSQQSTGKQAMGNAKSGSAYAQSGTQTLVADLDGDGKADTLTIDRGTLVAALTKRGLQAVTLPSPGPGAVVLSLVTLQNANGAPVPVVLVRLAADPSGTRDTAAALVNGWIEVLRLAGKPVQLLVDAHHGYGCSNRELALAGNPAAYVVQGNQLVPSPRLRAVLTPAGAVSGC